MESFRSGETVFLRGREVIFCAPYREGTATIRYPGEKATRIVSSYKLARTAAESIERAHTIPAQQDAALDAIRALDPATS